jgi:hypothetical protein
MSGAGFLATFELVIKPDKHNIVSSVICYNLAEESYRVIAQGANYGLW